MATAEQKRLGSTPPLRYHAGQLEVQDEARTRTLADHLAHWTGPVAEFAEMADLVLLALTEADGTLRFTTLSGPAPLADALPSGALRLRFPAEAPAPSPGRCGGLVISLALARRARINGLLVRHGDDIVLEPDETFTLCRKYMAPSVSVGDSVVAGPSSRCDVTSDSAELARAAALIGRAETAFLASTAPDGSPDVAHRGGPPGFIQFDARSRQVEWPEYLGDGVFKSAGNVRATGTLTLLVPDFDGGPAVELVCSEARYANVRTSRGERLDPLVQDRHPYPFQGTIAARVDRVLLLTGAAHSRTRIPKAMRVTSASTVDEQAPQ